LANAGLPFKTVIDVTYLVV